MGQAYYPPFPKTRQKGERTMWKKIKVNIQNIKHETDKAMLIAMPHSSDYDGFTFWISKKLVRDGSNDFEMLVSINEDMTFNLKRTSEKTRKVLDEKEVGCDELIEAFGEFHGAMRIR